MLSTAALVVGIFVIAELISIRFALRRIETKLGTRPRDGAEWSSEVEPGQKA